jgi:hypothetical protein
MARRNGFVESVKASYTPSKVGGLRSRSSMGNAQAKDHLNEVVKASVKREERFRSKPVNHSQHVG